MGRTPPFIRWLALAALADWLITRTLARAAIFMPKPPPVLAAYRALILGGQLASSLSALLALLALGWLAWQSRKEFKGALSLALLVLLLYSLVALAIPPGGVIRLIEHLLTLMITGWIGLEAWRRAGSAAGKIAVLLPGLALGFGGLYQASQNLYEAFGLPGPPPFALALFNLGELFAVLTPVGIWWASRAGWSSDSKAVPTLIRGAAWWRRGIALSLLAAIPAMGFSAFTLLNPSMAGILAIWSTGLTLYLPWPLYAVSLWLFGMALLTLRRQNSPVAWALLLLAASGYAPQLSSQVFFGLIGLSLITIHPDRNDSVGVMARECSFSPDAVEVG